METYKTLNKMVYATNRVLEETASHLTQLTELPLTDADIDGICDVLKTKLKVNRKEVA